MIDPLNKIIYHYWDRLNNETQEENIMAVKIVMFGDPKVRDNVLRQVKSDLYYRFKNGGITAIEKIIIIDGNVYKVMINILLSLKEVRIVYSSIANAHTYDSIELPCPNFIGGNI